MKAFVQRLVLDSRERHSIGRRSIATHSTYDKRAGRPVCVCFWNHRADFGETSQTFPPAIGEDRIQSGTSLNQTADDQEASCRSERQEDGTFSGFTAGFYEDESTVPLRPVPLRLRRQQRLFLSHPLIYQPRKQESIRRDQHEGQIHPTDPKTVRDARKASEQLQKNQR
ncbi:hypothetical protein ROHU_025969 [Labeo rohita]|uniref:Uncharacterized protein n=1 Tax=Labeo rohita TaxID=84645 RepID=A0A498LLI2_LABRO|nr:hypothetical protein ROHU_032086 [Labeo rohita]RXN18829.1 hypothetical protein ROHU_025969 [Labeo rohita]